MGGKTTIPTEQVRSCHATSHAGKPQEPALLKTMAYAAAVPGVYFFYVPMFSVLPGIYAKYFGLALPSIAAVILIIRLFDGVMDITIGYASDWNRAKGGSRKTWVVIGGLGSVAACYFLFMPPAGVTTSYFLSWSLVYFLALTIAEIPYTAWGSELASDYEARARVFAVRGMGTNIGAFLFYALPLLPVYASDGYTPKVLHDAVYVGAVLTLCGLAWLLLSAPEGVAARASSKDRLRLLFRSIVQNKPLLTYFGAYVCVGLGPGMWFGLLYSYLDGYLGVGDKIPIMFLAAIVGATLSTPVWLKLINKTSKSTAWAFSILVFCVQLAGTWFIRPGDSWLLALLLVVIVHLFFYGHAIAALSILGDIADYGRLKFRRDRSGTYFGFNTMLFKFSLGVGGGTSLVIAGLFGFDPGHHSHSPQAIFGLKLGFCILPAVFALLGLGFVLCLPIDRRRHSVIRRRIDSLRTRDQRDKA